RAKTAVIDGEIVCLDGTGRSVFHNLMFGRATSDCFFYAFELLFVDGKDLRKLPLIERKQRLRKLIPSEPSRLLYVDHIEGRGCALFRGGVPNGLGRHRGQAEGLPLPGDREALSRLDQDQEPAVFAGGGVVVEGRAKLFERVLTTPQHDLSGKQFPNVFIRVPKLHRQEVKLAPRIQAK